MGKGGGAPTPSARASTALLGEGGGGFPRAAGTGGKPKGRTGETGAYTNDFEKTGPREADRAKLSSMNFITIGIFDATMG